MGTALIWDEAQQLRERIVCHREEAADNRACHQVSSFVWLHATDRTCGSAQRNDQLVWTLHRYRPKLTCITKDLMRTHLPPTQARIRKWDVKAAVSDLLVGCSIL